MRTSLDPRWWHRNLTTFQKVVVANSAIIAAGAVSGPLITLNFSGRTRLPFLLGLLAIGLVAILVANFLILRLAFKPMRELESTMSAVQPGLARRRSTWTTRTWSTRTWPTRTWPAVTRLAFLLLLVHRLAELHRNLQERVGLGRNRIRPARR